MKEQPLRTTVIGSYPFPSWLELATGQLNKFGTNEIAELQEDAVIVAIHDQVEAGLHRRMTSAASTTSWTRSRRRAAWASWRNTSA
jgi:methionine synthase II (cobalamin-independent)